MGAEGHPAVAGACGYWDNGEYLYPPHEAAEREHREGFGECVSEVRKAKPHHEGGAMDYFIYSARS